MAKSTNDQAFYALLVGYSVLDVAANLALKRWLDFGSKPWLATAIGLYVGCAAAWAASLRCKPFYQAQLLYAPVALLAGVAIVALTEPEQLTWRTMAASGLALAAVGLLEAR